jgi:hypothetical protein
MGAVVIKIDKKNNRLISRLAKELGGDVLSINDEQYEDLALGRLMDEVKTGKNVNRDLVFEKLRNGR